MSSKNSVEPAATTGNGLSPWEKEVATLHLLIHRLVDSKPEAEAIQAFDFLLARALECSPLGRPESLHPLGVMLFNRALELCELDYATDMQEQFAEALREVEEDQDADARETLT